MKKKHHCRGDISEEEMQLCREDMTVEMVQLVVLLRRQPCMWLHRNSSVGTQPCGGALYKDAALWRRTDFAEIVASPVEKAQAFSCALQKRNSLVRTQLCSRETAVGTRRCV